jgi:membrane-associated phospholipid phosphatase
LLPHLAPVFRTIAPDGPVALLKRVALLVPVYVLFVGVNLGHAWFRAVGDDVAPFSPLNVAQFDIAVFGTVPSATLQGWLGTDGFWADVAFLYWSTLFWVPVAIIAVVALTHGRAWFVRLLLLHAALVLSADLIYNIVPTRPPWMDVELVRIIAIRTDGGTRFDSNPFAALPSLHVAVPAAYAVWAWRSRSARLRWLGIACGIWALGMGWCVVYTGEHYVIDVVTGYAWAAITLFTLGRLRLAYPSKQQPTALLHSSARRRTRAPVPAQERAA